jgi:UDP-3-O-[3-hydroxymyristoyl] glucosamine N-acyltransferase
MVDGKYGVYIIMKRSTQLTALSKIIDAEMMHDSILIDGLNLCNRESQYTNILSYATSERYLLIAAENKNIVAMVLNRELTAYAEEHMKGRFSILVSSSPEVDFYKIHTHLYRSTDFYDHFDFPAQVGKNPCIHHTAIIEDGVIIGNDVFIEEYAVIKRGSVLGDGVYIGCHATIGSEGFQIVKDGKTNVRIVHAGGCQLSNGSAVLHSSIVCKALFEGVTFVGENAMIDGLVWVGHNCVIEAHVVLPSGVTLTGSVCIKKNAWVGAGATVLNRVSVGENSLLGIGSVAIRDIPDGTSFFGNPARIYREEVL